MAESLKLIGVEVRVGVRGMGMDTKREVKIIPLDVVWPAELCSYFAQATAEVTFHTSLGDVTLQAVLPTTSYDPGKQASHDDIRNAMNRFVESLTLPHP